MSRLSLIAAMDRNRLIGANNALPWHLPADLAFFKRTTMGKPIIMGRKTFESIGKPLPGRRNIVVTRNPELSFPGCELASSVEHARRLCIDAEEIMLIGGASLYAQTIDEADALYITQIHASFDGDTWFPAFDTECWKVDFRQDFEADHSNPYPYSFIKYVREI